MSNENHNSKKLMLGIIVGGAVGATALYFLRHNNNRKTPVLQKIGKTLSDVGEMLENGSLSENVVGAVESKLPSTTDVLSTVVDWVDTGLSLWKKFK